ncbi:hypothetical protein [Lysinibacillus sp. 38-6]|uniref:hypothetical protein n=1 Tax=Lysinibacillus sp. 38-6 TaxID=3385991 RepID=UPI0039088997
MELAQAVSKIAELPKILEKYGIAPEDVLKVEYNLHRVHDTHVEVHLYSREFIEKLGDFQAENIISDSGDIWTHYKVVKAGISFMSCKRQQDCIFHG